MIPDTPEQLHHKEASELQSQVSHIQFWSFPQLTSPASLCVKRRLILHILDLFISFHQACQSYAAIIDLFVIYISFVWVSLSCKTALQGLICTLCKNKAVKTCHFIIKTPDILYCKNTINIHCILMNFPHC